jgi:hypothetical protein
MTPFSALVDASTSALLSLSTQPNIISFLARSQPLEAEEWHGVNWPNYRSNFILANEAHKAYPNWTWHETARLFSPTAKELLTDELKRRAALAVRKCSALQEIIYELSVARYPLWRGLIMQETIYQTKKTQAQRFKDLGYPEIDILLYPYVLQYADFAGLTLRAAADEILFKAKLDDDGLLKSELLRLKYFNLVRDAEDGLDTILKDFRWDMYRRSAF